MAKVEVTKFIGFGYWFFNMRYLARYEGCYKASNSQSRAISKVLKAAQPRNKTTYFVGVTE